jgi:formyl-CoA transferase
MGIMMAVHARHRTGRGQLVDAALYESVFAVMENLVTEYDLTGYTRERSGSILPGLAPSNVYPCAGDDMILIGANGDRVFARLAEAMGRPQLASDPRYVDHPSRGAHQTELDELIADWTRTLSLDALLALLEEHGVPASRVYRAPEMLADPQFAAREAIIETDHPIFGRVKMQNVFPKLGATPGAVRWAGPALGEHTEAVLAERAGCSAERIAELRAKGVI